ncbi:acyltransferase [Croceicoccus sp. BE223]|uniref:acyltransferase family protein n=1 Tax=Croceicoccus sp. BE223 TaxID=2817716 RepID=UPI00286375B6|nr:acyltransferase [Croceicoccus sp. BE223]MDR7101536.1 peptidoglycan/LPS O-acetylase OafA/YrhL [Croceicoccus sp. BE223]
MGKRLYGLDALRGLAALAVFIFHLDAWFGTIPGNWTRGGMAVDLFFAISGFVMARTFEPRLASGDLSPVRFMVLRYRRLWPVFAIGCAIGAANMLAGGFDPALVIIAFALAMAFLPAPLFDERPFPINGPGWSLFYELAANILHAVALARIGNRALLCLTIIAAFSYLAATAVIGHETGGTDVAYFLPMAVRALSGYLIGMAIFRFGWQEFQVTPWVALTTFVLAMIVGPMLPIWFFNPAFCFILTPVMIIGAARMDSKHASLCAALGLLSYPLYATHRPVIDFARSIGLEMPGAATLSLTVSALLVILIEQRRSGGIKTVKSRLAGRQGAS